MAELEDSTVTELDDSSTIELEVNHICAIIISTGNKGKRRKANQATIKVLFQTTPPFMHLIYIKREQANQTNSFLDKIAQKKSPNWTLVTGPRIISAY